MPTAAPRTAQVVLVSLALIATLALAFFIRHRLNLRRALIDPAVAAKQPILPGQSLGPISLGMTEDQVAAALGKPDSKPTPQSWQYRDPDIAVQFSKTSRTVAAIFAGGAGLPNVPYAPPKAWAWAPRRSKSSPPGAPPTPNPPNPSPTTPAASPSCTRTAGSFGSPSESSR
jgi:hypothetical protein